MNMIQYDAENDAADSIYDQFEDDMFQTNFDIFPDRGPADLEGNTPLGFRPLPNALEVAIGIIQIV